MKQKHYLLRAGVLLILLCIVPCLAHAQAGKNDPTFNTFDKGGDDPKGANGPVYTTLLLPDGKIMIGGSFSAYNGKSSQGIARLNIDGSLDATFHSGLATDDYVNSIVLQENNKLIISGNFKKYKGKPANRIARLNKNGSLDNTFKTGLGADGSIENMALQKNGKLIIQGNFSKYNNIKRNRIARLNPNGKLDLTFNYADSTNAIPGNMALQKDDKIIIIFQDYSTNEDLLIRLNANGEIDPSFNAPKKGSARISLKTVKIQEDGKIVVGGISSSGLDAVYGYARRFNADGTMDENFDPNLIGRVYSISIQNDGKIIFAGMYKNVYLMKPYWSNTIQRVNPDGSNDDSFHEKVSYKGIYFENYITAVQLDGKIILGGYFQHGQRNVTRLNEDGSLDISFNKVTGANGNVQNMLLQPNGKILISGNFSSYNYTSCNTLARLNANGKLDAKFNSGKGVDGTINCITVQPDKKIIVAGEFAKYNGTACGNIIRLYETGTVDLTLKAVTNGKIASIDIQPDHKIIIAGTFTSCNGAAANAIVRLFKNGTIDPTFVLDSKISSGYIRAKLQDDGKILIGTYYGIHRLNTDGSLDSTFKTNTWFENIEIITVQDDGKILVGGNNTVWNDRGFVVRLNPNGMFDSTFTDTRNFGRVGSITVLSNGKLIVGEGESVRRLNADGTVDTTAEGPGANAQVWCAAETEDGKILIGGDFTSYDGSHRNGIARIVPETPCRSAREADITAKDEALQRSIIVYPNPAAYNLTIANLDPGSGVAVLNVLGELIDEKVAQNEHLTIETSNYTNGIYFIRTLNNGSITNTKFIVNK